MKLTADQKQQLKALTQHKWYQILLDLSKEFENTVLQQFKTISLWDEKQLQELNAKQNYLKGMEDFIKTVSWQTQQIAKRDFK